MTLLMPVLIAGCGFLSAPPTEYRLAPEWDELLATRPELATWAGEQLTRFFGTPAAPRLERLAAWEALGLDPNHPGLALGHGGSGEIDARAWQAIRADNRERFETELERLAEGDPQDLGPWPTSPDLTRAYAELLTERETADFESRARALFVDHYPSLADSAALYAKRCLTCHGTEGGGDGPGSRFLEPAPRDFRHGVFKLTGAADLGRPRRADLLNVIRDGIRNTAMPSYSGYSSAELQGLADYVRFLAMRGETERWWIEDLRDGGAPNDEDAREAYGAVFDTWWEAESAEIPMGSVPRASAELVALGRRLFHDPARGNCAVCHGPEGSAGVAAGPDGALFRDAWGDPIVPRDLARGPFRYGESAPDLYRRVYAGINGTPMPGVGGMLDADGALILSERDLWAIVHYLRALRGLGPDTEEAP